MVKIYQGDCISVLKTLPAESVNCCVTSPPYWGLRDYGVDGQLGLERTPEEYVSKMVDVFREVRRVLRGDGTLWLNLGDSYCSSGKWSESDDGRVQKGTGRKLYSNQPNRMPINGLKHKDLVGIPWMVAFALRADGWYLRQDIIWHKHNPMPESVRDRCTKAHEYIFLMSKWHRYFYDAEAIKEPDANTDHPRNILSGQPSLEPSNGIAAPNSGIRKFGGRCGQGRNKRSVWTVKTAPFPGAHFATFPPKLIEPCILAGCPMGGTVLDPFGGSGTVGMVAEQNRRNSILIELNPKYVEMARRRTAQKSILAECPN